MSPELVEAIAKEFAWRMTSQEQGALIEALHSEQLKACGTEAKAAIQLGDALAAINGPALDALAATAREAAKWAGL